MILSIIVALLILSVVVFFHELGHFIFAKKVGIKVHTFSVGFGPRLWGVKKGGTDYRISAVPFGGYVAMAGEEIDERTGAGDEFGSKSVWERFQVVFAGPLMNFVLAFLVIWVVFMAGVYEPSEADVVVGWVQEDSPAVEAGFSTGDTIVEVDGKKPYNWGDFINKVILADKVADIKWVDRNGVEHEKEIPLERDPYTGMVTMGIAPGNPSVINSVNAGSPAADAGLIKGDLITQVDGADICCAEELIFYMTKLDKETETVRLTVKRDGDVFERDVRPQWDKEGARFVMGLDLTPEEQRVKVRYNPFKALGKAFTRLYEMVVQMLVVLKLLFSRALPVRSMGGAIGIVQMTSKYTQLGIVALLQFVAFISINLGIVNLLPIPIADGGQIVFLMLEKIMKRPLSKKTMNIIMNIGLYLVILLLILTTYNDIVRIIKGVF